ncbi:MULTISPECIES: APC family permease [Rhodanobacter]|uniref:Amino acid/polyamine/organocation transporter, APC superfamily n=1 Tax=Rhodanobacter glycinis TaxID=582702 RepID=A0A1I4D2M4_9GAMM|nr:MULTISPECIES: amino acid permease [Rhodanobacter]EIM02107.1 amino acid transporter [Rhodanobacter sp. 115]SFK87223.1 amino acid/polyamine/organocation transporter, APC superfamily [Rhodanobacter glycinis]
MTTETSSTSYLRRLGVWDGAMIVIGGVIGAGIFRTPATVAERTSSGLPLLALWVLGGLLTLTGVLCYAELGSRRPQAGGIYLYLREAFGTLPAFLFGWTMALINYPGSVAAVATTFADYFCKAVDLPLLWVKPVAVGAIIFIVGVNLFGIRAGALMQNVFAVLKLTAIALLVVVGLVLAHGHLGGVLATDAIHPATRGAFVGALLPVLFTYGGFHYLNDMAGEVRDPQRTLPRALTLGMVGVVVAYVLANIAYLVGLGHAGLAASQAPAADLMHRLFGTPGAKVMAIGIACSTFGYCSIAIAGGARVLQTMGADGMLFRAVGYIEPRTRAPQVALALLGAWTVVLTLWGNFGQLVDYTTVGEWLGHVFGIGTLFWYRWKFVDEPAPYRVPLFPLLPLVFVVTVLGVITATVIETPGDAGMSLVIIALGVPVYWVWRRWQRR